MSGGVTALDRCERLAVGFVSSLRRDGLDVPVGSALRYHEALSRVGLARRDDVYWAGRATLVHDPDQVPVYDRVFAAFWTATFRLDLGAVVTDDEPVRLAIDTGDDDPGDGDDPDPADDRPVISLRWSPHESLATKDFADYDDDELAEAHRLMATLVAVGGRRPSRRRVAGRRAGGRPDLGRTVRRALRTGGEPVERRHTVPGTRLRRVVFLLDVSGSMEAYARALVRFAQAAVVGRRRVEVFTLGTRLTRVTRELSSHDPDRALAAAGAAVEDWSGGTRLGDAVRAFLDEWGQRGMARGATVVILSDGWDRGEPAVLGEQMARLHRLAHQVIWVNPLKATPGYAPLAGGMAAALPHVDRFVEGHDLRALEHLGRLLADEGSTPERGAA